MLQSLFILILVQGLVSSQDENEPCYKRVQEAKTFDDLIPDREQLLSICPATKAAIDCEIGRLSLPDEEYKLEILNIDKDLINELCDENSELHKVYSNSVLCYRSMIPETRACMLASHLMYLDFRSFISQTEDNNTEEVDEEEKEYREMYLRHYEPVCLDNAYIASCLGIKIQESCGSEAHDAFVELLHRSRTIKNKCEDRAAKTLRNEFLDFLAIEKEHAGMDTIRAIFNFERK